MVIKLVPTRLSPQLLPPLHATCTGAAKVAFSEGLLLNKERISVLTHTGSCHTHFQGLPRSVLPLQPGARC